MKLRDVSNFLHLKQIREDNIQARLSQSKVRLNPTAENVMKALEEKKVDPETKTIEDYIKDMTKDNSYKEDIIELLNLQPTIDDINPGQLITDGKASSSFTSTFITQNTSNATRLATIDEIREGLYKKMRQLNKKGYIQLQTNYGNLNIEISCEICPKTSYNFINLCNNLYYNNTIFHRLITNFMVQGGDPTGTGTGGESIWKESFKDEFDNRILHSQRGMLSMANSGCDTNNSQFFIIFQPTKHLDLKHTVFGKVVGGLAVLDRIEAVGNNKKEQPLAEIKILNTIVFTNPIDEAYNNYKTYIIDNINKRKSNQLNNLNPIPLMNKVESKPIIQSIEDNNSLNNNVGRYLTPSSTTTTSISNKKELKQQQDDKIALFLQSQNSLISQYTNVDDNQPTKKLKTDK